MAQILKFTPKTDVSCVLIENPCQKLSRSIKGEVIDINSILTPDFDSEAMRIKVSNIDTILIDNRGSYFDKDLSVEERDGILKIINLKDTELRDIIMRFRDSEVLRLPFYYQQIVEEYIFRGEQKYHL
ncbi:hypothetical protein GW846_02720 [Candidatus Gracilibacteria bacterium]|nr:hypothetical protein [Candidatus Gracilibacteria bacterium]